MSVVFDTGPILCTLDQHSSNTTSGVNDEFMAALYPTQAGILSMPSNDCSSHSRLVKFHLTSQSSSAKPSIQFRLLRIYDNENIQDFLWKTGGIIYGLISGVPLEKV